MAKLLTVVVPIDEKFIPTQHDADELVMKVAKAARDAILDLQLAKTTEQVHVTAEIRES